MSDIFEEIDQELRREDFVKLWRRYGNYVLAGAILIVLAVAAVQGWFQYRLHQRQIAGERYTLAIDLVRQGKDKEAADVFAGLARQASGGHAMLARFEEAALKARSGDTAGAIALYDALSADLSLDPAYRDLATLLGAQDRLKAEGDANAVIARLKPLTEESSPWRPTALELTALAEIKAGKTEEAFATYRKLSDDLDAPADMRARAAEIIGSAPSAPATTTIRVGNTAGH